MKNCSRCEKQKPFNEFYKNKKRKNGCSPWCKECDRKYRQQPELKERTKKYRQEYYQINKERIKRSQQEYYKLYKEKIIRKQQAYQNLHKEKRKQYRKRYHEVYKDKENENARNNYRSHWGERRRWGKEYYQLMSKDRIFMDKRIDYHLRTRYGLTLIQKQQLFDEQHGMCLICKTPFRDVYCANVDHDESTKKIRGLLCNNCNRGIGHLKHNIDYLKTAILYLERMNT